MTRSEHQMPSWTEFLPADESDYLFPSKGYIAFEGAVVSFLRKQDLVQPNHLTYFRFFVCFVLLFFSASLTYLQIFVVAALGALSDSSEFSCVVGEGQRL